MLNFAAPSKVPWSHLAPVDVGEDLVLADTGRPLLRVRQLVAAQGELLKYLFISSITIFTC